MADLNITLEEEHLENIVQGLRRQRSIDSTPVKKQEKTEDMDTY